MRPALLKAYRATRFEVAGMEIRVGRRCPAMDRLLQSFDVREAVFITAWNPLSRVMPPGWNHRMQVRLALAARRRPALAGRGSWRGWTEAHLIVFGDARPSQSLARRFRQNGIVTVRLRQPARLVVVSRIA